MLTPLRLPVRYEVLQQTAVAEQEDVTQIIVPVLDANKHVEELFLRIEQARVSRLEVLFGESGCGKTTFLETLPLFFKDLEVTRFDKDTSFGDAVAVLQQKIGQTQCRHNIVYLFGRDNPTETDEQLYQFFESLREYFRNTTRPVVVIWPVSLAQSALKLYTLAAKIGSDSLVGNSKTFFTFSGPPKDQYYDIADATARLMNKGLGLVDFGIDAQFGKTYPLFTSATTIAQYFQRMMDHSIEFNKSTSKLLQQKPRPKLWILVGGDEGKEVMATVHTLTSGTQRKLDVAAMTTEIAEEQKTTQYMRDWKKVERYMPFLLRNLDIRVVEVPPSLALAVIRAFGDTTLRTNLKQQSGNEAAGVETLRESVLGELILGSVPKDRRQALRKTEDETRREYIRIQSTAKSKDGPLNAAFADAITELLQQEGQGTVTVGKRQSIYGSLRPDVHVAVNPAEPICLEFTWRTTGSFAVDGVRTGDQNTLTPGHIRQYVLNKAWEYVKALGLDEIDKIAAGT